MSSWKFAGQQHYEEIFATSAGWIVVVAEVRSSGKTLRLENIAIEPLETRVVPIGVGEVLAIRQQIETRAKQEGYTHLEISGYRISGRNPNRPIFLERRLA